MALRVTLSNDVADYLMKRSQELNKPCDQIADELLRGVMSSEGEVSSIAQPNEFVTSESTVECLNQTLDDLYVEDYFEKMRQ